MLTIKQLTFRTETAPKASSQQQTCQAPAKSASQESKLEVYSIMVALLSALTGQTVPGRGVGVAVVAAEWG